MENYGILRDSGNVKNKKLCEVSFNAIFFYMFIWILDIMTFWHFENEKVLRIQQKHPSHAQKQKNELKGFFCGDTLLNILNVLGDCKKFMVGGGAK